MTRAVTVLATGPQALVQDLGRPGNAHLGVPPSGALDPPSLALANRLVGNPGGAAGLEVLLGGLVLRAETSCSVAVTGPATPALVDGVPRDSPLHLAPGDVLALGTPVGGLRCYVALSGGVDVPAELGSRSTDLLSGLGPAPLAPGDVLPLGTPAGVPVGVDVLVPVRVPDVLVVPVLLGPRDDWFTDPAGQLRAGRWTVSDRGNRVGVRLTGTALEREPGRVGRELPSEGLVTGAVQVPADGAPVVFLADHPTTGGYPVIGVVPPDALPLLGQAPPGTPLVFAPGTPGPERPGAVRYSDS
ncbi:biotin-dependent carboxyltransferase family protein [Saccharothrix longispora]|uniref:5-oxoprolinase subunit C family protein n=1 Tax=Saccharothrix longispora TaxID=33920 RepID=UPI0028FDA6F6|nr:biotin-dependent carboxyltransferase family protein [Saccharothrix longispora]MDU0291183.1 biotin-dependent carboxyltransferase family protein [Saccharothrix longispora]